MNRTKSSSFKQVAQQQSFKSTTNRFACEHGWKRFSIAAHLLVPAVCSPPGGREETSEDCCMKSSTSCALNCVRVGPSDHDFRHKPRWYKLFVPRSRQALGLGRTRDMARFFHDE